MQESLQYSFGPQGETPEGQKKSRYSYREAESGIIPKTSPKKIGRKTVDTEPIHVELSMERERNEDTTIPLKIPVERMSPKYNYIGQTMPIAARQSSSKNQTPRSNKSKTLSSSTSAKGIQKTQAKKPIKITSPSSKIPPSKKPELPTPKNIPSETRTLKSHRGEQIKLDSAKKIELNEENSEELTKLIEKIVDTRIQGLQQKQATPKASAVPKTSTKRKVSSESKRKTSDERRLSALSSKKNSKRSSYLNVEEERKMAVEDEEEKLQKSKEFERETLRRCQEILREKEEQKRMFSEEKMRKQEKIEEFNRTTRQKNRVLLSYTSNSPIRHKYAWGADQQKLEFDPTSGSFHERSHERSHERHTIDQERRREELGLGYLNSLDRDDKQRLFRTYQKSIDKLVNEEEDKYQPRKRRVSQDEKEKRQDLVKSQINVRKSLQKKEKIENLIKEDQKRARMEKFMNTLQEIRAKDAEEKRLQEETLPKKSPKKKKSQKKKIIQSAGTNDKYFTTDPTIQHEDESDLLFYKMQLEHDQQKAIRLLRAIILRHTLGFAFEYLLRLSVKKAQKVSGSETKRSLHKSHEINPQELEAERSNENIISPSKREELFDLIKRQRGKIVEEATRSFQQRQSTEVSNTRISGSYLDSKHESRYKYSTLGTEDDYLRRHQNTTYSKVSSLFDDDEKSHRSSFTTPHYERYYVQKKRNTTELNQNYQNILNELGRHKPTSPHYYYSTFHK